MSSVHARDRRNEGCVRLTLIDYIFLNETYLSAICLKRDRGAKHCIVVVNKSLVSYFKGCVSQQSEHNQF